MHAHHPLLCSPNTPPPPLSCTKRCAELLGNAAEPRTKPPYLQTVSVLAGCCCCCCWSRTPPVHSDRPPHPPQPQIDPTDGRVAQRAPRLPPPTHPPLPGAAVKEPSTNTPSRAGAVCGARARASVCVCACVRCARGVRLYVALLLALSPRSHPHLSRRGGGRSQPGGLAGAFREGGKEERGRERGKVL